VVSGVQRVAVPRLLVKLELITVEQHYLDIYTLSRCLLCALHHAGKVVGVIKGGQVKLAAYPCRGVAGSSSVVGSCRCCANPREGYGRSVDGSFGIGIRVGQPPGPQYGGIKSACLNEVQVSGVIEGVGGTE